jgi:soluble lytic murein transglycosylase-like protein
VNRTRRSLAAVRTGIGRLPAVQRALRSLTFAAVVFGLPLGLYHTQASWRPMLDRWAASSSAPGISISAAPSGAIASFFTPEVQRWGGHITRWASEHGVDPNLMATVMQIESCGDSDVASHAGAQGLFQVMPFHFSTGEVMTDPETNARRGGDFLAFCMDYADNNSFLALACYNGGPSVVNRQFHTWPHETQRYYVWGSSIYNDARAGASSSGSLQAWLDAGGSGLCAIARQDDLQG